MSADQPRVWAMDTHTPAFHLGKAKDAISRMNKMQSYSLSKTCAAIFRDLPADIKLDSYLLSEEELLDVNPATFARNKRCSNIINDIAMGEKISVADIGGGSGLLSHFIPNHDYILCEPSVNGLYAEDLIAMGIKCDISVSVHVIEHIRRDERKKFISNLLEISDCIIINCPVANGQEYKRSAQELIYKFTNAAWALEHMECTMPTVEDIIGIGESLQLNVENYPGSNFAATLGYVFLHQIASASADKHTLEYYREIKHFINKRYHLLDSHVPSGDHFFILTNPAPAGQPRRN